VSRYYHNVTARYNGYYYSNLNRDEGIYKTEKNFKDNFDKILPVYMYPTADKAKTTFPEFDKSIKKSSLCIQKHAIKDKKGNEIPSAGKWIDNNWINIGIAHFYKREFFSAIEAFDYVARTYTKSDDKFTAIMWLVKANNEIGSVTSAETYLSFLKNERNLPRAIKNEMPALWADYYIRRGQYTEATAKLMEATRNNKLIFGLSKKRRARYSFIIAQLSEQMNDNKRAMLYYNKTIQLKPNYDMVFYSKIRLARLMDVKHNNSQKIKKDLLKMTRETKNSEYFDVIYYTLGEIEEKERHIDPAIQYYNKSVQTSVNNPNQKALSFLKLAEINFDRTNYQPASAYYDSTIATLPVDHPDYNNIIARKKTLETLVTQIKTISREDSLQRVAKMSEKERNAYIDKVIANIEKEEERKKQEMENLQNGAPTNTLGGQAPAVPGSGATFYFYNPTAVSFGVTDFARKWGNRKLEDNWRRSQKALVMDDAVVEKNDTTAAKKGKKKEEKKLTREMFLEDLPLNDTLLEKSNSKMIRAYYMMGSIYKEELHNNKKTIATFEELNKRFPENKYSLNSYYSLYRIYLAERNNERAEYYKNKILAEFPESDYALLIKNPDYAQELNAQKSEVESFYAGVYDVYRASNYRESYDLSNKGIVKFGKNDYLPKFEFIRAMSLGKLKGVDSLERNLKLLVGKYPNSEVTPLSQDILAAIKKQKAPLTPTLSPDQLVKKDTFQVNFESMHFVVALLPDDSKIVDAFKTNVGNFNSIFFSEKKMDITSSLFGKNQIVVIKTFADAKEAINYQESLIADPDVFKGNVKKAEIDVLPVSADNLPFLYQTKNFAGYKVFYGDTYKRLNSRN
jgi:tetratricopeptide (TPR) repeat protein